MVAGTLPIGPGCESDQARFWAKVGLPYRDGCLPWLGAVDSKGYGQFSLNGRLVRAARYAYALAGHSIPDGMEIDHLCRMHQCVRPDHLEPVTPAENNRRSTSPAGGNARKTHCPQGHRYSEENTYVSAKGWRWCRTCRRDRKAKKRVETLPGS